MILFWISDIKYLYVVFMLIGFGLYKLMIGILVS